MEHEHGVFGAQIPMGIVLFLISLVVLAGYNATEGWAPSTYMEKLPARYRTLDRP